MYIINQLVIRANVIFHSVFLKLHTYIFFKNSSKMTNLKKISCIYFLFEKMGEGKHLISHALKMQSSPPKNVFKRRNKK